MILLFFTTQLPSQKRKRPNCCPLLQVWALFRKMGIITDDVHGDEKHTSRVSLLFESMPAFIFHVAIGPSMKNVSPCRKSMNGRYTCLQKSWYYCGLVNSFDSAKDSMYNNRYSGLWKLQDRLNFEKWNGEMVAGHWKRVWIWEKCTQSWNWHVHFGSFFSVLLVFLT